MLKRTPTIMTFSTNSVRNTRSSKVTIEYKIKRTYKTISTLERLCSIKPQVYSNRLQHEKKLLEQYQQSFPEIFCVQSF